MSDIKVHHPAFSQVLDLNVPGVRIVAFKVPTVFPTDEAKAFAEAFGQLADKFNADVAALKGANAARAFGGHISRPTGLYLSAKPSQRSFLDSDLADMRTAVIEAFPNAIIESEWHNASSGWPGYSIRIIDREDKT